MSDKTVSKKGTAALGGLTIIAAQGELEMAIVLAVVLTVYICVQGFLDYAGKPKDVSK